MRRLALILVGLLVATTLAPATASTSARHAAAPRMCTDLAANQLTVEVLGDSIGAGIPGATTDSRRWQPRLASQIPGSAVWNGAVPGSQVRDYLPGGQYRFHTQFTLNVKPSLVILVFRANDQWMSTAYPAEYSPTVFKQQMLQLVNEIRAASPSTTVMIAVAPWIQDIRIDQGTYTQWDFIVALWDVMVSTNSWWVDWGRFMPRAGEPTDEGFLIYDRVHPSDIGQAAIAAHTYEGIDSRCLGATL
jgi:lysophospholipase L1-like esterase